MQIKQRRSTWCLWPRCCCFPFYKEIGNAKIPALGQPNPLQSTSIRSVQETNLTYPRFEVVFAQLRLLLGSRKSHNFSFMKKTSLITFLIAFNLSLSSLIYFLLLFKMFDNFVMYKIPQKICDLMLICILN